MDVFQHKDKNYLITVDYYSRDVEISQVPRNVNAAQATLQLKKIFSRHGIPDILFNDNGPQFDSQEFTSFADDWQFKHITSPRYPQSNGDVERAVQAMKMILKKSDDEYLALLTCRETPLHHGYSPAQLSMGRRLRTRVPCQPEELTPKTPDSDHIRKKEKEYRAKMKLNYDHRHRVVEGDELSPGDRVWIPDLKVKGTVVRQHEAPRSVVIQTPNGQVRRNRRMTRRVLEDSPPVLQQHSCHETFQPTPKALWYQTFLQHPEQAMLVPENLPAVNEPSQEEAWSARLRPWVALRKPQRFIENC